MMHLLHLRAVRVLVLTNVGLSAKVEEVGPAAGTDLADVGGILIPNRKGAPGAG